MASTERPRVAGLVLAAGLSRRLGQPKQLLPYRGRTLLDHTLDVARACAFDQLLCVMQQEGSDPSRCTRNATGLTPGVAVDLGGVQVVENPHAGEGCSSSIAAALRAVEPTVDVLVLLLGDQPGVRPATVAALLEGRRDAAFAVCRYDDGRGHPFAFGRAAFAELAGMHGDKAVWRLLDRHAAAVVDVAIAGPVPPDVDTWADYAVVLAAEAVA